MTRFALGTVLWGAALALAAVTALVQVENYSAAAELHRLVDETEWNARRCSGLVPELEGFEFELCAEQTRALGPGSARPSR